MKDITGGIVFPVQSVVTLIVLLQLNVALELIWCSSNYLIQTIFRSNTNEQPWSQTHQRSAYARQTIQRSISFPVRLSEHHADSIDQPVHHYVVANHDQPAYRWKQASAYLSATINLHSTLSTAYETDASLSFSKLCSDTLKVCHRSSRFYLHWVCVAVL